MTQTKIANPTTAEMTVDPVEVDTSAAKKAKQEKKAKKAAATAAA